MRYRIGADNKSCLAMEMDTGSARAAKTQPQKQRNPRLPENHLNSGRLIDLQNMAALNYGKHLIKYVLRLQLEVQYLFFIKD
jgi:hypothetical protein